jgi:hypothetical protein
MSENWLALRVGQIHRRFHDGGIHIHRWPRPHECSGEELDAVEAHFHVLLRHLLGIFRAGSLGELHLGRQINGVPILGEDVASHQIFGPQISPASSFRRIAIVLLGSEPKSHTGNNLRILLITNFPLTFNGRLRVYTRRWIV